MTGVSKIYEGSFVLRAVGGGPSLNEIVYWSDEDIARYNPGEYGTDRRFFWSPIQKVPYTASTGEYILSSTTNDIM